MYHKIKENKNEVVIVIVFPYQGASREMSSNNRLYSFSIVSSGQKHLAKTFNSMTFKVIF